MVNATGQTTAKGVWAAGHLVDPRAQVITSTGAGSPAAIAINADLVHDDIQGAVIDFNAIGGNRSMTANQLQQYLSN